MEKVNAKKVRASSLVVGEIYKCTHSFMNYHINYEEEYLDLTGMYIGREGHLLKFLTLEGTLKELILDRQRDFEQISS